MRFFGKELTPDEKKVESAALDLISSQLESSVREGYSGAGGMPYKEAPAAQYARELLKEAIKNKDIEKAIDNAVRDVALEEIVKRHISEIVRESIANTLREGLLEGIVTRINGLQVKK